MSPEIVAERLARYEAQVAEIDGKIRQEKIDLERRRWESKKRCTQLALNRRELLKKIKTLSNPKTAWQLEPIPDYKELG